MLWSVRPFCESFNSFRIDSRFWLTFCHLYDSLQLGFQGTFENVFFLTSFCDCFKVYDFSVSWFTRNKRHCWDVFESPLGLLILFLLDFIRYFFLESFLCVWNWNLLWFPSYLNKSLLNAALQGRIRTVQLVWGFQSAEQSIQMNRNPNLTASCE